MKQFLLTPTRKKQYILLLADILIILAAGFMSYLLKIYIDYENPHMMIVLSKLNPWLFLIVVVQVFVIFIFNQYNLERLFDLFRSPFVILCSVWLTGGIISCILFFAPKYIIGRKVVLIYIIIASFLLVGWRFFAYLILIKRAKPKRLAVVGNGQIVHSFVEELANITNSGFKVNHVCLLGSDSDESCASLESLVKHENLLSMLNSYDFDVLAFDSTNGSFSNKEVQQLLQLKYMGKAVYDLSTLYKNLTGKVPLTYINGQWLLTNYGFHGELSKPYLRIKRFIDIVISSILLIGFSPLFLFLACLIKAEGKGRILYKQERLGKARKSFVCYKFRTMIEDAEKASGPVWSNANDVRLTRIGAILRKTRMDEFPQLLNILRGELSFIGPRPIREHFANQFVKEVPFYEFRYNIKPGLSGWAQVNDCYAVPYGLEALQYELFYIQNMSLILDLIIFFKTLKITFHVKGK